MKFQLNILIAFALASTMLMGCEKVIEVDLNSSDPQVVLDADLVVNPGILDVKITQTADYFGTEAPATIEDASVILIDGDGNTQPVPHLGDGQYGLAVTGQSNESFRLEATVNGVVYRAEAVVPELVEIVGLRSQEALLPGGFGNGNSEDTSRYNVFVKFQDRPGTSDYYRIIYQKNGTFGSPSELMVFDDKNFDGQLQEVPIQFGQKLFDPGDRIAVYLICTDASTNNYYQSLAELVSSAAGPGGGSAAPGNPKGNWSDEALGHFAITQVDSMTIVIP